jgi:hypothetical protein
MNVQLLIISIDMMRGIHILNKPKMNGEKYFSLSGVNIERKGMLALAAIILVI